MTTKIINKKPEKASVKKIQKNESNNEMTRAVGRRKCASARVRLTLGKGNIIVNGLDYKKYFSFFALQEKVLAPLKAMAKENDLDISVKVVGGGKKGQAEAVQLGIARALVEWNADFKKTLKTLSLLKRDARKKERKKFGLKKARRAPQWSKR